MPSEVSPRSFERPILRPSSSAVPGSATATVSPAPKFQAPHTIWRGAPSPTSTCVRRGGGVGGEGESRWAVRYELNVWKSGMRAASGSPGAAVAEQHDALASCEMS